MDKQSKRTDCIKPELCCLFCPPTETCKGACTDHSAETCIQCVIYKSVRGYTNAGKRRV